MMEHTEKTKKALEDLLQITSYPYEIISTDEFADRYDAPIVKDYSGVYHCYEKKHTIGINYNRPEDIESSFVHECIHGIMDYQGFPQARVNTKTVNPNNKNTAYMLGGLFIAAINHPEVYRRMKVTYDIDMEIYFQGLIQRRLDNFKKKPKKFNNLLNEVFHYQQDIIAGFEYEYFTPTEKNSIYAILKEYSPNAHDFLIGLRKRKLKFDTPKNCVKSANEIIERVKKSGEKKVGNSLSENYWNHLIIETN